MPDSRCSNRINAKNGARLAVKVSSKWRRTRFLQKPWLISLVATALTWSSLATAQSPVVITGQDSVLSQLIVLFDDDASRQGVKSDELIDAVKAPAKNDRNAILSLQLDSPSAARPLLGYRINFNKNSLQKSPDRPNDDPPGVMLQKYVVLTYASPAAAAAALNVIQGAHGLIWAGLNHPISPSAALSDPYVPPVSSILDYQWGLYQIDAFSAWDTIRGHAYVGHIDTGVKTGWPSGNFYGVVDSNLSVTPHPDLTFNFKMQFAYDEMHAPFEDFDILSSGHGTHTAGTIAANATNPYVQYGHPNPTSQGGAGVCWYCALMVAKVFGWNGGDMSTLAAGLTWSVDAGAQIANMSLGTEEIPYTNQSYCGTYPNMYDAICVAISYAQTRDVVISAAAGNGLNNFVQFPASDSRTIAVGASQYNGSVWVETDVPQPYFYGSDTGAAMANHGVLAPGKDILSTFPGSGYSDWNAGGRCGDSAPGSAGVGYGDCTGTSMAAPHVSGVLGLMRSLNPLLSAVDISSRLLATSANSSSPNNTIGYGIINANSAVLNVLSTTNRLTPLFSLYSSGGYDYFYTTVPQMGSAAVNGSLLPTNGNITYAPVGSSVGIYPFYPGTYSQALAQVWIFTSHNNPANPSVELRPLYRLSYKCGDPLTYSNPVCITNPYHVDHLYSTDINEVNSYTAYGAGYKLDGIEGYVYPIGYAQPSGTVGLVRSYNATLDDWAIYPYGEYSNMLGQGYTDYATYIGYVYANSGSRPTY